MDSFMLQDEGVRDRIRQAEEFLDPSMYTAHSFLAKYCCRYRL
jgi:DNA replication licensing factor MCM3